MSRLYLDENIGSRYVIDRLVDAGHSVTFCRDLGYRNVPDDVHYFLAARRNEVLVTTDYDFVVIHGSLMRFARLHGIAALHAGMLVLPQQGLAPPDFVRFIDAFFAAQLPINDELYEYRSVGGWTRFRLHTVP